MTSEASEPARQTELMGGDDRWGAYVPWFLRHTSAPGMGDFDKYFARVAQRFERLMNFNEAGVGNPDHFGARLETDSFQRYQHRLGVPLGAQLKSYFDPSTVRGEATSRCNADPEERRVAELNWGHLSRTLSALRNPPPQNPELARAGQIAQDTRAARFDRHWRVLVAERLGVVETILVELHDQATASFSQLIHDLRRACAEAQIPLDIRGTPPRIIPMDERLLQSIVIDPLLARLQRRWPERAEDLIYAYHDVRAGRKLDEVFSNAFKSLEEIARSLTGDPNFEFTPENMKRHFPSLHPTVGQTIYKLKAHRGDAASHGRRGPNPSEIRYLLFQVCNIALLLVDQELPSATT